MSATPTRPRPVTWSGWVVVVGSVLVLWSAVEVVAGIGSLETRESVEEFLGQPPGGGLGVDVEEALAVLRATATLAAACAAAAAILGWHVLRRSRGARVGLSVLALPLFLSGTATGGLVSALVVAAIVSLWLQPARAWFDGREPDAARARSVDAAPTATTPTSRAGPATGPDDRGLGGPPGRPGSSDAAGAVARRPTALVAACLITMVIGSFVLVFCAVSAATLWLAPDVVAVALSEQEQTIGANPLVTVGLVQVMTSVLLALLAGWTIGACVLAALALRGRRWARTGLLVSACLAGAACGVALIGSAAFLVPLAACVGTAVLLARADVRSWP